jgi:antirestriction protein ArdC
MQDLYQQVTDKIIATLESGVAPWVKPWNAAQAHNGLPYNAISGKAYRGINIAMLYAPQYATNAWMTFKQAKDIGANVRKGERGSMIVFFKPFAVKDKNAKPDANGNQPERLIPLLKCFHVFNVAQIDNLPEGYAAPVVIRDPLPADSLLEQAQIVHGGDRAFYQPAQDFIRLPQPDQFRSLANYQATALHELTHWTGHSARLAREYGKRFGDQAYAREELVAEMGAAFLCARCGIDGQLQHPEYLASWLKVLKEDKRAILTAASHAQKAADFILREQIAEEKQEGEAAA